MSDKLFKILARVALGATIITLPFRYRMTVLARPLPPVYADYTDILLFASDIFLVATLLFWGISLALARRRPVTGPFFLWWPIVGLLVTAVFSVAVSVDRPLSLYHLVRLVFLAGLYLYIVNEIQTITQVIVPLTLQILVQAVVAIAQFLQQHSVGLQALGELQLDPMEKYVSIVWAEGGMRALRAYGLTNHPNLLGGSLAFGLLLLATWLAHNKGKRYMGATGAIFMAGMLALFLTFSSQSWLVLGGGFLLVLLLLLKTRQRKVLGEWVSLAMVALILLAPFIWQNSVYLGIGQPESPARLAEQALRRAERDALNEATNQLFIQHAIGGVGIGALPVALYQAFPDFEFDVQPAYVVLLDVATEIGILGALFYLLLTIAPWIALVLRRERLLFSPTLVGVSGLLFAVTLTGFFDYYTWLLPSGRLWQWLILGIWAVVYQSSKQVVRHSAFNTHHSTEGVTYG